MKQFLKNNYALVVGVTLPLALIAVFFLAGRATVISVAAPQFDAVFAANYYPNAANNRYRIGIDDGKLYIRLRPERKGVRHGYTREPVIYVFDHDTLRARKIDIDFENVVEGRVADPELDALNRRRIISDPVSPDGYSFERNTRSGGGLFSGVFGWRSHRSPFVLRKGVRAIPIRGSQAMNIYSSQFIGWVAK
ncbi:MAG: hypothetical protein R3229_05575 [Alphaproteobacteria bacterium]|nr:hypothetical protein [Alphaproteobacteria bacterium]